MAPPPASPAPTLPDQAPEGHRAGFVALCGRPNVGKSTLLNALLGEAIAVATPRPQTTRERLLGIYSRPLFQAALVDTPGIHRAKSALNRFMVDEALRAAEDVDLVLMLAEAPHLRDDEALAAWEPGEGALEALTALARHRRPIALLLTKCDRLAHEDHLLPIIDRWRTHHDFVEVIPTSARTLRGLAQLDALLARVLPLGPRLYDPEQLSTRQMRWHAGEIIRGVLFERLADELPYSCAITIESYRCEPRADRIVAAVHVERDSQKGILIGQGGAMIRTISAEARARIAELAQRPVDLFLEVRVTPGWTRDPKQLESLGYVHKPDSRG